LDQPFQFYFVWSRLNFQNGLSQLQKYYFNAWGAFALIPISGLEIINPSWIRLNKYAEYIFHPAHMALLVVIAIILKTY
jgi:hypothetical protein